MKPAPSRKRIPSPYYLALKLVCYRLLWDLQPKSWISRSRLRAQRGSQGSKLGLILCNGPSLNAVDWKLVEQHRSRLFIFGLNKIHLLYPRIEVRPDCVVAVNHFVIKQTREEFNRAPLPLYLSSRGSSFVRLRPNVCFIEPMPMFTRFSHDVSRGFVEGSTVTFTALQLAYHLGLREVALVGCDHSFADQGKAHTVVRSTGADRNHFDPSYFGEGTLWQLPDLIGSEYSYGIAAEEFAESGGRVINCTEGGRLEVFPRLPLRVWLQGARQGGAG